MVRVRYLGVRDPEGQFKKFAPMHRELANMRTSCTPSSADYKAVCDLIHELDRCATHFTGREHFFTGDPSPSDPRTPR